MKIDERIVQLSKIIPKETLREILSGHSQLSVGRVELLKKLLIPMESNDLSLNSTEIRTLGRIETQFVEELVLATIEKNSSNQIDSKSINLHKRFLFIKNIFNLGLRELSVFYAKKLLKEARQLFLDDLCLLLADFIEYYYSFISFDFKKAEEYSKYYNEQLEVIRVKKNVSRLYYELINRIVKNKSFIDREEQKKYKSMLDSELPKVNADTNITISQRVYSCHYFFYLLTSQYEQLYKLADETLNYYQKYYPNIQLRVFMSFLRRGVSLIYLKSYDRAKSDFQQLSSFNATPGTLHWNSWQSNAFILEMLTKNYQQAAEILLRVSVEPSIIRLDDIWLQQWRIRSAYIHFLVKIEFIDLARSGRKRVPNFRLGKFLNEVPHYSKDKRGLNISILVAQFIILLANKKYGQLIDRSEALSKYSYRHLKNNQNLRSNCFIRMLLALVKADFNPIRATRYAQKYIDKLGSTQMNLNEYSTDIEIIPYEDLWQIILDISQPMRRKRA